MATLYSIGYGNRSWEDVRRLLVARDCEFLIDVRSSPFSKFNPLFSKDSLARLCHESAMRYVYMGATLGGRPVLDEHFDSDGKVDYTQLSKGQDFRTGLSRLVTAHSKQVCACIMCSELRPQECHRCKLIGIELKELGIEIVHIDEVGADISQDEAIRRVTGGQDDIFGTAPLITRSRGVYRK